VNQWRSWPNSNDWQVTPETARLLQYWRHHRFNNIRPFFCQVEAVETAIWLTEVASKKRKPGKLFLDYLNDTNDDTNPGGLMRLALKLATGAGKTTIMAMNTLETEGQMLQRVVPDLMGMKNIMVLNDEAHHCYREKPGGDDEGTLRGNNLSRSCSTPTTPPTPPCT